MNKVPGGRPIGSLGPVRRFISGTSDTYQETVTRPLSESEPGSRGTQYSDGEVSLSLLGQALDAVPEGSLITDAQQRIVYANTAFTALTGYSAEEVMGRNCRLLQGPGSDFRTVAALRTTLSRQETFRGEILNYRKDGTPFWNALTVSPLRDSDGALTHFVSVQRDITAQKALQDRLLFLALHDPVTGLPNRTALDQHLTARRGKTPDGSCVAVGVIDLDDFKPVNDLHGHETGDSILREFATRMRAALNESDFLARLGGDEFVLVIGDLDPNTAKSQLGSVTDRFAHAMDTPFTPAPGVSIRMGMSLGLALWATELETGEAVLRRADTTLYQLKARKTNRTRWWHLGNAPGASLPAQNHNDPSQQPPVPGTSQTPPEDSNQQRLARGYRERLFTGGLVMHFQPVLELRTGKIHLLEALARLQLEDGTIVEPGAFLPQLSQEDTNRLFQEGLDQTLAQLAAWETSGHRLRASINLHPSTLLNQDCSRWVAAALKRHHLTPDRLVLELLEAHVEDKETKHRTFNELLSMGVGMAQDDLGAGHSSIRRLTALPFDTVKIDRHVTTQLNTTPIPTLTFLSTMVSMGQDMGWNVIAEGLEDPGITEAATIIGIPCGQGHHLAQPMPAERIPQWIQAHSERAHPSPLRTPAGALAFHWQYARLSSPHPGPLNNCPLTAYLARTKPATNIRQWHQQLHAANKDHPQAAANLTHWLTEHLITTTAGQTGASSSAPYPGQPDFLVLPF